jgi:hypothetical protein
MRKEPVEVPEARFDAWTYGPEEVERILMLYAAQCPPSRLLCCGGPLAWEDTPIEGDADSLLAVDEVPSRSQLREREQAVRIRRRVDAGAQRYEISVTSANEVGPPPDAQHVRVENIRGSWTVEPGREGKGSVVCYDIRSEPDGRIPSWVARAPSATPLSTSCVPCSRARRR